MFAFLDELTPAGRGLYPGLCPAERQGSSLSPALLHTRCGLCQRPVPRPLPVTPEPGRRGGRSPAEPFPAGREAGIAGGERGTGKAPTHTPWLRRPPAIPAPRGRGAARGGCRDSQCRAPGPGFAWNLPHTAFNPPGRCRDPPSEGTAHGGGTPAPPGLRGRQRAGSAPPAPFSAGSNSGAPTALPCPAQQPLAALCLLRAHPQGAVPVHR